MISRRDIWSQDFFFFNDTATTEIYTLSLHDALPIFLPGGRERSLRGRRGRARPRKLQRRHRPPTARLRWFRPSSLTPAWRRDRKSTRLNSSHANISYAVFCLKKKIHMSTLHSLAYD